MHIKYYQININIAPTCFGVNAPSSGSLQVVPAKVMNYENDQMKYISMSLLSNRW